MNPPASRLNGSLPRIAAGLGLALSAAALVAAQDQQASPPASPPAPGGASPGNAPNQQLIEKRRRAAQAEAEARAAAARHAGANAQGAQGQQGQEGAGREAPPDVMTPPLVAGPPAEGAIKAGADQPAGAAPTAGASVPPAQPIDPESVLTIEFTEPVNLMALVDWVSRKLNVPFIPDDTLQNAQVVFKGPLKIKAGELLNFLGRVLDEKGFVLSRDAMGLYSVKPANSPQVVFSNTAGALATTRIIPTPMVRPSQIQQAVQTILGGTATPGAAGASAIRITPIDEIGVLVVTASPSTLNTVEQLVDTLIGQLGKQTLHRFQLENVAADFALNRILQLNGKATQGSVNGVPVAPPVATPGAITGTLTQLDTRLFVAPGNALVFRGPDNEAEEVHKLIDVVDVVSSLIAKRYVTGSVTQEIASAGERMGLGPITQTAAATPAGFSPSFRGGNGVNAAQNGQNGELPGSGFTVDAEHGSIIYYGTQSQQNIVADLVKTFTEQALNDDDVIRVYKLVYAKVGPSTASSSSSGGSTTGGGNSSFGSSTSAGSSGVGVAAVLQDLLQAAGNQTATSSDLPRGQQGFNRGTASPLVTPRPAESPANVTINTGNGDEGTTLSAAAQSAVVVADADRNQILVKAPGPVQRQIGRIIEQLDQRQPQVYIEAKIISVSLNDTLNWSADLQIDGDAFQFLSSFGLTAPVTGALFNQRRVVPAPAQGTSGVTAAILHQDRVLPVINALETVAHGRVVSTPRILVNDNQQGKQQSLREEPFSATQVSSGNPTITSQGGTAEAGTKLTATPTISKNGDIILDYAIELSSFDRSGGASTSGLQPPKQTENYNSIVTVPSDSTIVVGGFTLDVDQNTESKVPFLGDIPLIGLMFKSIDNVRQRTMLFVFITPKVLNDPAGADLRILTEGPMQEVGVESPLPPIDDVAVIPIGADAGKGGPGGMAGPEMDGPALDPIDGPDLEPAPATPPEPPAKPVAQAKPARR